jgi:hypothetical protein
MVLLPQFNGQLRITFQTDAPAIFREVEQGKHLPDHFENQGGVIEREALSDSWFANAVFSDFFNIHRNSFFT